MRAWLDLPPRTSPVVLHPSHQHQRELERTFFPCAHTLPLFLGLHRGARALAKLLNGHCVLEELDLCDNKVRHERDTPPALNGNVLRPPLPCASFPSPSASPPLPLSLDVPAHPYTPY